MMVRSTMMPEAAHHHRNVYRHRLSGYSGSAYLDPHTQRFSHRIIQFASYFILL